MKMRPRKIADRRPPERLAPTEVGRDHWQPAEPAGWLPDAQTQMLRGEHPVAKERGRWNTAAAVLVALLAAGEARATDDTDLPAAAPTITDSSGLPPVPEAGGQVPVAEVAPPTPTPTERLQAAFGQVAEQAADRHLLATVPAERLARAEQIVEKFPVEKVAAAAASLAGAESDLVLQRSALETVVFYSPQWMTANNARLAQAGEQRVDREVQDLWNNSGGFSALEGKFIGINVDYLQRIAREEQFEQAVRETVVHEFLHTLPATSFDTATAPERTDLDWLVYEGITQALTISVITSILPKGEVLDTAYQTGIKQAGYLVVETLGPEVVYSAYLNDRAEDIVAAWNAKFGAGSWERAMATSFGLQGEEADRAPVKDMYALYGLLKEMGPAAKAAYLQTNNAMENSHILALFSEQGQLEGAYVRDDRMEHPITAGLALVNYPLPDGQVQTYLLPHLNSDLAVTGSGARYEGRQVSVSRIVVPPTSMTLVGPLSDGQVTRFLQARLYNQIEEDLVARGLLPKPAPEATAGDTPITVR